jgi:hypothetical protein
LYAFKLSGFDDKFISAIKYVDRDYMRFVGEHKMINLSQSSVSIGFFIQRPRNIFARLNLREIETGNLTNATM